MSSNSLSSNVQSSGHSIVSSRYAEPAGSIIPRHHVSAFPSSNATANFALSFRLVTPKMSRYYVTRNYQFDSFAAVPSKVGGFSTFSYLLNVVACLGSNPCCADCCYWNYRDMLSSCACTPASYYDHACAYYAILDTYASYSSASVLPSINVLSPASAPARIDCGVVSLILTYQ